MVNFLDIVKEGAVQYRKQNSMEIQMIDMFSLYSLSSALIQLLYRLLVGEFPFNSFVAGFVSSIGLFIFTVCLRLQLTSPEQFGNISRQRVYADYVVSNLLLFFVVVTFIG